MEGGCDNWAEDDDGYKYLGILEADDVKQELMKERLK